MYERLGEIWGITIIDDEIRNSIKKLTMVLFFGRGNTIRKYRYLFNNAFPNVYNVMKKMKRKSYKILATTLMRMEREIMIDCVVNNLIQDDDKIPLLTIHDGILTTEEYNELLKSRIQKEIKDRIGFVPKVKIKSLQN